MTARDEVVERMAKMLNTPLVQVYEGELADVLDAIPADVLARLAIERGGLEGQSLEWWWLRSDEDIDTEDVLYRLAEVTP